MLALVLLVLSVLAAPAVGSAEVGPEAPVEAAAIAWADDACCDDEIAQADVPHPCVPGESCPDSGGCCACVSCCKRVANAPADLRPDASGGSVPHEAPSGGLSGTEEVGAIWHPPRG